MQLQKTFIMKTNTTSSLKTITHSVSTPVIKSLVQVVRQLAIFQKLIDSDIVQLMETDY